LSSPAFGSTIQRVAIHAREDKTMNTLRFGTVAAILVLAGCAHDMGASGPGRTPNKFNPIVDVVAGAITVDQEVIAFGRDEKNVKITWHLVQDNYRFPADGIVFASGAAEFAHCGPQANGLRYSCVNVHSRPGRYKYTINVSDLQGKRLTPLDPIVQND
jgi:hypothetical protein